MERINKIKKHMSEKISDEIFENFGKPIEETKLYNTYKFTLIQKAKKSDGSGAVFADKENGIELRQDLDDNTIETIFIKFFKEGRGWAEFTNTAPCGLMKNSSREDVLKLLGKPDWSVEKGGIGLIAVSNSADKWFDEISNGLRVEYAEDDKSIKIITIQSKKLEDSFK